MVDLFKCNTCLESFTIELMKVGSKTCCKKYNATNKREKWRSYSPEQKLEKSKKKYKIGLSDYNDLLEKQEYKCAICETSLELGYGARSKNRPCVDHCHTTNEVRGILCSNCNASLGLFKDSITMLNKAIKYSEREYG